jgi:hypothetical protein
VLTHEAIRGDLQTSELSTGTSAIAGRAEELATALGAAAWDESEQSPLYYAGLLDRQAMQQSRAAR